MIASRGKRPSDNYTARANRFEQTFRIRAEEKADWYKGEWNERDRIVSLFHGTLISADDTANAASWDTKRDIRRAISIVLTNSLLCPTFCRPRHAPGRRREWAFLFWATTHIENFISIMAAQAILIFARFRCRLLTVQTSLFSEFLNGARLKIIHPIIQKKKEEN